MKSKLPSPIVLGVAANVVAALIPLTLMEAASGSSLRPMGEAALMGTWAVFVAVVLVPIALYVLFGCKQRLLGSVSLILALSPALVSLAVQFSICVVKNLSLKE